MGERKVLNKYIPHDFDPKLVPRSKKPKDELVSVRMMLPFTIQCSTCSSFMYRGRKFNSKKENVKGAEGKYLGIQRYRFYLKCAACSRPLTFLTDPENADYEMETGGTRTYEVHKDRNRIKEEMEKEEEKNEKEDPMKALENRVLASQKEMADLDNLDEIKAMNMRHLKMMANRENGNNEDATTRILNAHHKPPEDTNDTIDLNEEDEELIKSIKFGQKKPSSSITRLTEQQEQELELRRQRDLKILEEQQKDLASKINLEKKPVAKLNPLIKVKRKRKVEEKMDKKQKVEEPAAPSLGLLAGYGSDSDSD